LGVRGPEEEVSDLKSSKLILNSYELLLLERVIPTGAGAAELESAGEKAPNESELGSGELCGMRGGVVRWGGGDNCGWEVKSREPIPFKGKELRPWVELYLFAPVSSDMDSLLSLLGGLFGEDKVGDKTEVLPIC
jgi:hypothetical protein